MYPNKNPGEILINPDIEPTEEKKAQKTERPVRTNIKRPPINYPTNPMKLAANDKEKIDVSRRRFLKGGLALAGAIAVGETEERFKLLDKAKNIISSVFKRKEEEIPEGYMTEEDLDHIPEGGLREEDIVIEEEPAAVEVPKKEVEYNNIADHYLHMFNELSENEEFFPKDLFTEDLFIAQQLQESNFDSAARSHKGAVGVMQNMDISIQDDSLFLEKLHNEKVIKYDGPIYVGDFEKSIEAYKIKIARLNAADEIRKKKSKKGKFQDLNKPLRDSLTKQLQEARYILQLKRERYGNRILTKEDLKKLEGLRIENPDYSRALGKIFLMKLYNKQYGFGVGQEAYKKKDIKGARTALLGCYNAGFEQLKGKPIEKWPDEPRNYVNKIFNLMDRIEKVRFSMEIAGLDPDDNAAMMITREMNKVGTTGENRPIMLNKTLQYIINLIKEKQEEKGEKLDYAELREIFAKLEKVKHIHEKSFYTDVASNN